MGYQRFAFMVLLSGCLLLSGCKPSGTTPASPLMTSTNQATPGATSSPAGVSLDLLKLQGKIGFEIKSGAINSLGLDLENKTDQILQVQIPSGTFFVNQDPKSQNMVVLHPASLTLQPKGRSEVNLDVACANLHRAEPTEGSEFTVQGFPMPVKLQTLIGKLDGNDYDFPIEQAAVWIITDDASYDELGVLVKDTRFGTPVIGVDAAVQAMMLVDDPETPINQTAIWHDLGQFAGKVTESSLSTWVGEHLITKVAQDATESASQSSTQTMEASLATPTAPAETPSGRMTPPSNPTLSPGEVSEFAVKAVASSEYSSSSWSAEQATGGPDTTTCGDNPTAWASSPSHGEDWILLTYEKALIPTRILIYETYNPGAITKVEAIKENGEAQTIYSASPKTNSTCPNVLVVEAQGVVEAIRSLRLTLQHNDWSEIDAVELVGK